MFEILKMKLKKFQRKINCMSEEKKEIKKEEEILETKELIKNEPVTLEKINELLINNLKWSQIIYEQNRKINRKLLWNSIFNYLKVAIIIIPLIIGFFYLLPSINNLFKAVDIFSGTDVFKENSFSKEALESLLKSFPIDQAKQEQIKALLH